MYVALPIYENGCMVDGSYVRHNNIIIIEYYYVIAIIKQKCDGNVIMTLYEGTWLMWENVL